MTRCQIEERDAGRPYPRTCPTCGLTGPCAKGLDRKSLIAALSAKDAEIARVTAECARRDRDRADLHEKMAEVKARAEAAEARVKVLEDEIKRLRLAVKLAKSAADEWAISRKIGSPVIEGDKADALWKAMRRLSAISYGPIQGSTLEGEK